MPRPATSHLPGPATGRPAFGGQAADLPAASRGRQFLARLLVLLLIAAALSAARAASLRGVVFPVRIAGDSMADALTGRHFAIECRDCGYMFRRAVHAAAAGDAAVCPNCGCLENRPRPADMRAGQRVLIDAGLGRWTPRRWDVVALASPETPGRWETKRVVGLPGEFVELRGGDVWIDGRRASKSLGTLRDVAITVHDDRYRPRGAGRPPRWRNAGCTDLWRTTSSGYAIRLPAPGPRSGLSEPPSRDWHWLDYHHRHCMPSAWPPANSGGPAPVLDYYGTNQDLPRGRMFAVDDLRLQLVAHLAGTGRLAFEFTAAADVLRMDWDLGERELALFRNGSPVAVNPTVVAPQRRPIHVEFARCDGVVWFVMDGRVRLRHALDSGDSAAVSPASRQVPPGGRPVQRLRIGAAGPLTARLEALRVSRDLYYFHPLAPDQPWSARRLESDQYLLLGDNVPVSRDSRHWDPAGVRRARIRGRVMDW